MLNPKTQERELAYVVQIDKIEPIIGSDNCECAVVGCWKIMTRKGTFVPGDRAVYFEIDSKVDVTMPAFSFLLAKHGKIKTQKYTFGGNGSFLSQGLLMTLADLSLKDNLEVGTFLTEKLGVTYSDLRDAKNKAKSSDKYAIMVSRHPQIFKKSWAKWLLKRTWGKALLYLFLGSGAKKSEWPDWIPKTDEERVQNLPHLFPDSGEKWVVTEKIDGTSTTFAAKRNSRNKDGFDFYVCSRNMVFKQEDQECFYSTNVYYEMAKKYNVKGFCQDFLLDNKEEDWIIIQGETYGPKIQKRDYHLPERRFACFNVITSKKGRWSTLDGSALVCRTIPWVPIIADNYSLPDTCDALLTVATGPSVIDGDEREGFVFRSHDGVRSFKAVSNLFLLKYHC